VRDLLVAAGLLGLAGAGDVDETVRVYAGLSDDLRYAIRTNLTILSLLAPLPQMPDPHAARLHVRDLLLRLESAEETRS